MKIAGYLKTSLIEWPGKISSVIFVPGCNFRCPFCHNSDLVDHQKLAKLKLIPERKVLLDLKKRKKWIDGVAVTGGEPTLQEDLPDFLKKCQQLGFKTMIETNGSVPEMIRKLLKDKLVDRVVMDFKGTLDERYLKTVGIDKIKNSCLALPRRQADSRQAKSKNKNDNEKFIIIENVKKSMSLIMDSGVSFEFRTTVVPGMHNREILTKMAKQFRQLATGSKQSTSLNWLWQSFQPKNCLDLNFEKKKPYEAREIKVFLKSAKKIIPGTEFI